MKKLINAVDTVLAESLDGFAAAHADIVTLGEERKFVRRAALKPGKVALISGGGSGHEPLHAGFVGLGMLDAACPGQVFTSPTPDQMLAAAQAVDTGAGVALHRQELRRRRDEFRDGGGDGRAAMSRPSSPTTTSRSRTRPIPPAGAASPARCRREDRRRRRRGGRRPRRAQGAWRAGQRPHPLDGRGADLLHRAGGRQADLRARRGRDGDGRRHPRRARPPARQAGSRPTPSPRR